MESRRRARTRAPAADGCKTNALYRSSLQAVALLAWLGCTASDAQDRARRPASPVMEPAAPQPLAAPVAPPAPLAAPATVTNARVAEALRYDPADPLGNLESADELDKHTRGKRKTDVPPRGCAVVEEPRPVWSETGIASIAAVGGQFIVAGYASRADSERLFVVRLTEAGKLEPIATETLASRHTVQRFAGPGLAADASHGITVAFTDGRGKLLVQRLHADSRGASATIELSEGVDTRFAPAVAYGKRGALIAYTLGTTPMRSMLLRLDPEGKVLGKHDITPEAMGAAAPAFVSGASPPVLVTADARSGTSPIARVSLDSEGNPGKPQVAIPVGMMSQPPELAAAQSGAGLFVGYAGVGSAATSAVGVVRVAPTPGAPEPLVKGIAYGPLHLDAAASKHSVLFAMDAPVSAGKAPKHEIRVVRVDAQGAGPALQIAAAAGDATHAAIARGRDNVGVVFTAADGVYFARLACAAD